VSEGGGKRESETEKLKKEMATRYKHYSKKVIAGGVGPNKYSTRCGNRGKVDRYQIARIAKGGGGRQVIRLEMVVGSQFKEGERIQERRVFY